MKHWKIILLCLAAGAAGWFGGQWWTARQQGQILDAIRQIRASNPQYQLIQPLLAIEFPDSIKFREYTVLEQKIESKIKMLTQDPGITEISVYFRDMRNGHWVGINENQTYTPASLLKLPVLIAYLKQAETEPEILRKKILYAQNEIPDIIEENQKESALVSGQEYAVEELLRNMVVYSDNSAFWLLLNAIDRAELTEVFTDLGVQFPGEGGPNQYLISAKTYSLFFRILRNATFLSREMSERALRLLTEPVFKDGLVAGVPNGTIVAHKYGIVSNKSQGQPPIGLHDCGIVYHSKTPYILCVMTSGTGLGALKSTIKDISELVYSEVK